eukprot:1195245-Prorocentrum_minimum.AAC.6
MAATLSFAVVRSSTLAAVPSLACCSTKAASGAGIISSASAACRTCRFIMDHVISPQDHVNSSWTMSIHRKTMLIHGRTMLIHRGPCKFAAGSCQFTAGPC